MTQQENNKTQRASNLLSKTEYEESMQPTSNDAQFQLPYKDSKKGFDKSVVGSAFRISNPISGPCTDKHCDEIKQFLREFSLQPRDSAWASVAERAIQENIESKGEELFQIRNLECRTTLCGVEVASTVGIYRPGYPAPLNEFVTGGGLLPMWGYETDSVTGQQITVSVSIFIRK